MCWTTGPALVSQRGGELVVIGSSDSRREIQYMLKKGWDLKQLLGSAIPDPYNNDLYASVIEPAAFAGACAEPGNRRAARPGDRRGLGGRAGRHGQSSRI